MSRRSLVPILSTVLIIVFATLTCGCDTLSARFRAREGVDLYHSGDFGGASRKFEEAGKLDPTLPVLMLNTGTSNLAQFRAIGGKSSEGQIAATKAIRAYERYLETRPQDDRVKAALVQTFIETGRYEDAVVFFRPEIETTPPNIEALGILATVATKCNKSEEAQSWHQKRIDASPDKPDGYLALGIFLWEELHDHPSPQWSHEQRKTKADVAIARLKKAIDLNPGAPNGYTYVNLVYRELAQSEPSPDEKKKDLEEADRYLKMASERQKGG